MNYYVVKFVHDNRKPKFYEVTAESKSEAKFKAQDLLEADVSGDGLISWWTCNKVFIDTEAVDDKNSSKDSPAQV